MSILNKFKTKMADRKERSDSLTVVSILNYLEGIPELPEGTTKTLAVSPEDNKLYIGEGKDYKEYPISLDLDRIVFVENTNVEEVTNKNKSVLKRAVVGSLLGPLGTVVGGMSGIGSKTKKKDIPVLIIGYKKDEEVKQISFMGGSFTFGYTAIVNKLKRCTKDNSNDIEL